MLPAYKFVYDRAGRFWKTVIIIQGLAVDQKGNGIPYPKQMIVIDEKTKKVVMMDYYDLAYCDKIPSDYDLKRFIAKRFDKHVEGDLEKKLINPQPKF